MQVEAQALYEQDQTAGTKGIFDEAWNIIVGHLSCVHEVVVDVEALNFLQRARFRQLFELPTSLGVTPISRPAQLSETQIEFLKYLASAGGNLGVFFRLPGRAALEEMEQAIQNHFCAEEMPPLSDSSIRYVQSALADNQTDTIVSFAHDGEPVLCFVWRDSSVE
jgi:hypothetical protein